MGVQRPEKYDGRALAVGAKVARWQHCLIHYLSRLQIRFCINTVSNIMIIL